jgi:hypothetical protein
LEISVTDIDRNFRVAGGIAIGSKGELFVLSDGEVAGTNSYLILNEVNAQRIHAIHPPRLGKLEGHNILVALQDLDGIRRKFGCKRALRPTSCYFERDIVFTGAGRRCRGWWGECFTRHSWYINRRRRGFSGRSSVW